MLTIVVCVFAGFYIAGCLILGAAWADAPDGYEEGERFHKGFKSKSTQSRAECEEAKLSVDASQSEIEETASAA